MIPVSLPEPIGTEPRHFAWLSLAILVLGLGLLAEKVHGWVRATDPVHLATHGDTAAFSIGGVQFLVPRAFIAGARQSSGARAREALFDSVHLALTWPRLAPAGSTPAGGEVLRIDLESSPARESLRARLDPVYRRLARGGESAGPNGLRLLTLSARGAPRRDVIAYDPVHRNGFIARCRAAGEDDPLLCHRAVPLASGIELRYRFDRTLLADWRGIEHAVLQTVSEFHLR